MRANLNMRNVTQIRTVHYDDRGMIDNDKEAYIYDHLSDPERNTGDGAVLLVLFIMLVAIAWFFFNSNISVKLDIHNSDLTDQVVLAKTTPVYADSDNALNQTNSSVSYPAGTYYVDMKTNGCLHIYNENTSGAWILESSAQ